MTELKTDIARRTALKLVAAGGASLAVGNIAEAAPKAKADLLSTPAGRLRAFIQMRGALDDRIVMGCLLGRYYGVVNNVVTPLYGLNAATVARYKQMPDGSYEAASCEQAYFTDLETGEVLDNWFNPYTKETVKVPLTASNPTRTKIGGDLQFVQAVPVPGMSSKHGVLPVKMLGNEAWFTEENFVTISRGPTDKPINFNEVTTLHARLSDLAAPNAKRVPCDTHFSAVVSWRPWSNMGDHPGHLMGDGSGLYGIAVDQLSPIWLEATMKTRPQIIKDPAGLLDPVWKTLGT